MVSRIGGRCQGILVMAKGKCGELGRTVARLAARWREGSGRTQPWPELRPASFATVAGQNAGIAVVVLVVVAAACLRPALQDLLDRPAVAHWATIFVAIAVQAMPFLVLGVTVSAAIAAFVPPGLLPRVAARTAGARRAGRGGGRRRAAGLRVRLGADRRAARLAWRAGRGGAHVPPLRAGDQSGRPRRDRRRVPGQARSRRRATRSRACSPRSRSASSGRGSAATSWLERARRRHDARRAAAGGARGDGPARPAPRGRLPDRRRRDRGDACRPSCRASVLDTVAGSGALAILALAGARGRDGDLLRGGRVRRRQPDAVLADVPACIHGRRPDGRREADRAAGGHVRRPLRRCVSHRSRSSPPSAPACSSAGGCCDRCGRDDHACSSAPCCCG